MFITALLVGSKTFKQRDKVEALRATKSPPGMRRELYLLMQLSMPVSSGVRWWMFSNSCAPCGSRYSLLPGAMRNAVMSSLFRFTAVLVSLALFDTMLNSALVGTCFEVTLSNPFLLHYRTRRVEFQKEIRSSKNWLSLQEVAKLDSNDLLTHHPSLLLEYPGKRHCWSCLVECSHIGNYRDSAVLITQIWLRTKSETNLRVSRVLELGDKPLLSVYSTVNTLHRYTNFSCLESH